MSLPNIQTLKLNPSAIREATHLSREKFGRVMRVSSKTLERWEARGEVPDPEAKKNLSKIAEIIKLAQAVYTAEGVTAFLAAPLPAFAGKSALDLMSIGEYDRVISALAADYEGLGY
jgi:transcriptional regulator with XRE-family HTH domain